MAQVSGNPDRQVTAIGPRGPREPSRVSGLTASIVVAVVVAAMVPVMAPPVAVSALALHVR
jgi:hypothetical protein